MRIISNSDFVTILAVLFLFLLLAFILDMHFLWIRNARGHVVGRCLRLGSIGHFRSSSEGFREQNRIAKKAGIASLGLAKPGQYR